MVWEVVLSWANGPLNGQVLGEQVLLSGWMGPLGGRLKEGQECVN